MEPVCGAANEFDRIGHVLLRRPQEAFVDAAAVRRQWRELNYLSPPDFTGAAREFERFVEVIAATGARIDFLTADSRLSLDAIYVRDALVTAPDGIILGNMGKAARRAEPALCAAALRDLKVPVAGAIVGDGLLEGGDVVWLDAGNVLVGEGYRTNAEGIRQLRRLLGGEVAVHTVALPHWRGEADVFHLMSMLSPVDRDLAVVYARLLPVSLRRLLLDRGFELVEVSDEEFEAMGCNVLALAPRRVVMVSGNPRTRRALERAGTDVCEVDGAEISHKGSGGPTCLTRPIRREPASSAAVPDRARRCERP